LPDTRGPLARGPLDFAYAAYPIVTPPGAQCLYRRGGVYRACIWAVCMAGGCWYEVQQRMHASRPRVNKQSSATSTLSTAPCSRNTTTLRGHFLLRFVCLIRCLLAR